MESDNIFLCVLISLLFACIHIEGEGNRLYTIHVVSFRAQALEFVVVVVVVVVVDSLYANA